MIGVLLIFGASTLWALDTLIRYPLLFGGTSAWTIVWLEHLLLVLAVGWWLKPVIARVLREPGSLIAFLVIGGLGSALGTVAFTHAFGLINPSVVILIQKLQPVIAVSLAALILGERIDRRFIGLFAICIAGSLMIAWKDVAPALQGGNWAAGEDGRARLLGYGFTLFAVVAWGASTVFGKRLSNRGFSTVELMGGRFLAGFLVLTPCLFAFTAPLDAFAPSVASKVLLMVLLSGLGGMALYYLGMKRLPARTCAIAELFFPIAAVTINWVAIDAPLSALQLTGAAVLLGGSTLIALTQVDDSAAPDKALLDQATQADAGR